MSPATAFYDALLTEQSRHYGVIFELLSLAKLFFRVRVAVRFSPKRIFKQDDRI